MALTKSDPNVIGQDSTGTGKITSAGGSVSVDSSGNVRIANGSANSILFAANGFVGVGTSVPRSQLEVYKATTGGELRITSNSDTNYGELVFSSNNATYAAYGASIVGYGASSIDSGILAFKTGYGETRTERMRIDYNGNIGIGTSTPGSIVGGKTLTVYNLSHSTVSIQSVDGGNDRNATLELLGSGNGGSYSQILYGDTDTSPGTPSPLVFAGYHSGTRTERMRLAANGNLGIGTASPEGKLHVYSSNNVVITAHNPNYYGSSNFGKFQSLACATQFGAGESGTWKRVAYVSHSPILDVFGSVEQAGNPSFGGAKYRGAVRGTYGSVDMTEYLKVVTAMNGGGITGLAYRYNNAGYVLEVYLTYSGSGPYGVSTVIQGLAQDAITV